MGCILAELLGGRPFFKGRDYVDQLNQILHILGTPNEDALSRIGSPRAQEYVRNLPEMEPKPFHKLFPNANPAALDLLKGLLQFDPSQRITVDDALNHPYLQVWRESGAERVHKDTFNFDFEVIDDVEEMRKMILEEVRNFRQEVRQPPAEKESTSHAGMVNDVPMPAADGQWTASDPRPQEYVGPTGHDLEAELAAGLDYRR